MQKMLLLVYVPLPILLAMLVSEVKRGKVAACASLISVKAVRIMFAEANPQRLDGVGVPTHFIATLNQIVSSLPIMHNRTQTQAQGASVRLGRAPFPFFLNFKRVIEATEIALRFPDATGRQNVPSSSYR